MIGPAEVAQVAAGILGALIVAVIAAELGFRARRPRVRQRQRERV